LGRIIASYPKATFFVTLLAVAATSPGLFFFKNRAMDEVSSWVPEDHLYARTERWINANFTDGGLRYNTFIISKSGGNLLTAKTFRLVRTITRF
jgi:hypothetical protein